ncbi:unnamed protein product [Paramecium sonneborni]|uniref:Uncharacterized protein n=1 Tax=Paramecium sonneborni TaxID=65129 RepID=A0A8S1QHV6_9CILI|nr:unnamed protein product [Paramecium sonneborni]
MQIGKFQLNHLVEKNNEQNKFITIQLNRQPLLKVDLQHKNFQEELNMLFKNSRKPTLIPKDFHSRYLNLRDSIQSQLNFHQQLKQIRHTQLIFYNRTYLQIYTLYNYYYQEYQERRIKDRDFALIRIFRSEHKLTLIDFGFTYLQKQLPKKPWQSFITIRSQINGQNVINTLLAGKIKWEEVRDFISIYFDLNEIDQSWLENYSDRNSKITRSNSIYAKQQTQTLSMIPQEIITLNQNSVRKASLYENSHKQNSRNSTLMQTRIISFGNQQIEHFQKLDNLQVLDLVQQIDIVDCFKLIRFVSRKAQYLSNYEKQRITKPLENQFEQKNESSPRKDSQNQLKQNKYKENQHQQQQINPNTNNLLMRQPQFKEVNLQMNNKIIKQIKKIKIYDLNQVKFKIKNKNIKVFVEPLPENYNNLNKFKRNQYENSQPIEPQITLILNLCLIIWGLSKLENLNQEEISPEKIAIIALKIQRLNNNNNLQNNRYLFKTPRDSRQMQYSFQNSPIENPYQKKQNPTIIQYQIELTDKNEIPSFCQDKQSMKNHKDVSQQQWKTINEDQIINQDQRAVVESVDEYYKQTRINKQNLFRLPLTSKTDKIAKEQGKIELQQNNYLKDNYQKQFKDNNSKESEMQIYYKKLKILRNQQKSRSISSSSKHQRNKGKIK